MPLGYEGTWGNKDPDAKRWFGIDWSDSLDTGVVISDATWTIAQGHVVKEDEETGQSGVRIELSGGVDGEVCLVNCHISMSDGTFDDCTMRLDIRST